MPWAHGATTHDSGCADKNKAQGGPFLNAQGNGTGSVPCNVITPVWAQNAEGPSRTWGVAKIDPNVV